MFEKSTMISIFFFHFFFLLNKYYIKINISNQAGSRSDKEILLMLLFFYILNLKALSFLKGVVCLCACVLAYNLK